MIRLFLNTCLSVLLTIVILQVNISAQTSLYSFEKLSLEDGLSQSSVTAIFQDSKGFLWFGTANGLNKFDGYSFIVYKHDPENIHTLSNDMITAISEDKDGYLWIGTENGLNKFDPLKETSQRYLPDTSFNNDMNANRIYAVIIDEDGVIWFGTNGAGLINFNPGNKKFTRFSNDPDSTYDSSYDFIRQMQADKEGNLWLATLGGLSVFYPSSSKFHNYRNEFRKIDPSFMEEVYSLCVDNDGIIWFGTDGSLNSFDPLNGKLQSFISGRKDLGWYFRIWTILNDSKGQLWLGTGGLGIHIFDKKTGTFTIIRNNPSKPLSLSDNSVAVLFEDRGGVIWVGTGTSGINKFTGNKNKFITHRHDPENPNTITSGLVYGMLEDYLGNLWIGTTDGLNKIDKNGKVNKYQRKPGCTTCISTNVISDIAEDPDGNVWIATRWGLNRYDRKNNNFKVYRTDSLKKEGLASNNLSDVYADKEGTIWVSTFNHGFHSFNPSKEIFKQYKHKEGDKNTVSSDRIFSISEDNEENLIIGTDDGLNLFSKKENKVIKTYRIGSGEDCLSNSSILAAYCDNEGIIWAGTYGGGLNKIDRKNKKVYRYSERQGLPNNVVYGILPDDKGNLWLSTNKGLVRFNKKTGKVRAFSPSDGLQSYEFNSNSSFRSRSGEMFFGGVNGFNSFFPGNVTDNPIPPPVVITSVKSAQREIVQTLNENSPAEFSYNQNFITFDFVSLDYTNPKRNLYSYKLEGFDTEWIDSGTRRFAIYTNLSPGEYTFRVKGSNSDEVWNEQGASFSFIIHPPFWNTWWFYSLTVLVFIASLIFIHKYRLRLKVRQLLEMEKMRKKIADDFHDELGHKLTKISLYSELMRKDLNGNLKDGENYLKKINDAANTLFDDTKDFIWSIDPVKDTLYDLAVYLKDFGDELFDKTGIAFRVNEISTDLSELTLPMDWKRQLILIFKEAMNNCLRHSGCANVGLSVTAHNDNIEIVLRDDGKGFISNNGLKGRGLINMKSRADKIGAELIIDSFPSKGTTVRITGERIKIQEKQKQQKQR